ncbi:hypothetical protein ACLKA6_017654 [Drosophila palustris]
MIQLFQSHTGQYIKNKIVEIIREYDIELDQIFSITSDNGRNMVKAIELLNDDATEDSIHDENKDEETYLDGEREADSNSGCND